MAHRLHVQHIAFLIVSLPRDEYSVVPHSEHVVITPLQRLQEVTRPVLNLVEFLLDALLGLTVEIVESLFPTLGEEDIRRLYVFQRSDIRVIDLLS